MWFLRSCLPIPRRCLTLTIRPDSGHGQSLDKKNSLLGLLWKGERKRVSSSLEMETTVYKTQVPLVATSSLCEGSQLLAVDIIVDAQREGRGGIQSKSLSHSSAWLQLFLKPRCISALLRFWLFRYPSVLWDIFSIKNTENLTQNFWSWGPEIYIFSKHRLFWLPLKFEHYYSRHIYLCLILLRI